MRARIGSTVFRMGPEIEARIAEALSQPTPLRPEDVASMLDAELRRESRRVARATHGRLGPKSRARLVACFEQAFLAELGIGEDPAEGRPKRVTQSGDRRERSRGVD